MLRKIDGWFWLQFQLNYLRLWNRYGLLVGTFRVIPITLFWIAGAIALIFEATTVSTLVISMIWFLITSTPIVCIRAWHHLEVQNKQMVEGKFDLLNAEAAAYIRDLFVKTLMSGFWFGCIVFRITAWALANESLLPILVDLLGWVLSMSCVWTCAVIVLPRVEPEPKTSADLVPQGI